MPRGRSSGGRLCKLSVPVALALVEAVGRGESLDQDARAVDCGPSTLSRWLAAERAGDPHFSPLVGALGRARRSSGLARAVRRTRLDLDRFYSQF